MQLAEVRAATAGDAATLSGLLAEAIRDSYSGILGEMPTHRMVARQCALPRIRAEIGIPGGAPGWLGWLVATDADGALIGAAAGGVPLAAEGELYALCTAPTARRRGVGTALLDAATDRMRRHGARTQRVSLPVEPDPALPFYEARGFAPLAAHPPGRLTRPV